MNEKSVVVFQACDSQSEIDDDVGESSFEFAALRHGEGRGLVAGEIDLARHNFGSDVASKAALDGLAPARLIRGHVKLNVLLHPGLDLSILRGTTTSCLA